MTCDVIDRYGILIPIALFQYLICGLELTLALFASIFVFIALISVFGSSEKEEVVEEAVEK